MPRRQTTTDREIPLYLIPHMIMKRIRTHGEALERVIVRTSGSHYYNISVRTRPVKRELMQRQAGSGGPVPIISGENGEKV
ncbi:MAG: hypothetical protein NTY71_08640 [Methanoregula sp.]|jgi:hypothetical protein|nr:hypothetical protein [Methanoregula sp.]